MLIVVLFSRQICRWSSGPLEVPVDLLLFFALCFNFVPSKTGSVYDLVKFGHFKAVENFRSSQ
jgi:hypothetical protein